MYHKLKWNNKNNKCNKCNNNNLKILYLLICSILMFWVVSSSNSKELRRITLEELEADPYLMTGAQPFVLTGAMETWESLNKFQDLNFFIKNYPNTIVDHYPRNLANPKDKPYLQPMETVMQGFIDKYEEQEKYGDPSVPFEERYKHSQYIHWRMTLPEYQKIEEMFQPLPKFMKVDEVWMKKCFPDKQDDHDWPLNNFFRHAHWRIIVIGEKNSSMFLHADGFETATYVTQFVGRKRWMVCSPKEGLKFGRAGLHDLFHPETIDLNIYPHLKTIDCTDTIVKPGEIIYYPAHWWHQTLNLDTPTISMAGRRIDAHNYYEVAAGLKKKCNSEQYDIEKRWPGAAPILKEKVCKNIDKCHDIWELLWDTPITFLEAANDNNEIIKRKKK